MQTQIRPLMLVYTIVFGLLSIAFVNNNFENGYSPYFVYWSGVFYVLVFLGNFIYSIGLLSLKIQTTWKFIFPIIIVEFILSFIIDIVYGPHAHRAGVVKESMALVLGVAIFFLLSSAIT
jgi:hypothetical protein